MPDTIIGTEALVIKSVDKIPVYYSWQRQTMNKTSNLDSIWKKMLWRGKRNNRESLFLW